MKFHAVFSDYSQMRQLIDLTRVCRLICLKCELCVLIIEYFAETEILIISFQLKFYLKYSLSNFLIVSAVERLEGLSRSNFPQGQE